VQKIMVVWALHRCNIQRHREYYLAQQLTGPCSLPTRRGLASRDDSAQRYCEHIQSHDRGVLCRL
jgi:hypothetical protein